MRNHQKESLFFNAEKQELTIVPGAILTEPIALAAYGYYLRVYVGAGACVTVSDAQLLGNAAASCTFVLGAHSVVQYWLELSNNVQHCAPMVYMQEPLVNGVRGYRASVSVRVILQGQCANFAGVICVRGFSEGALEIALVQQHEAPHTASTFAVRQALIPGSASTVHGSIIVERSAHHVYAQQQLRGIVVESEKNSKKSCCLETVFGAPSFCMRPTLAVANHTSVVKHGCAVGELDSEQLFYMQARGVPLPRAKELLLMAFFACP